MIISHLDNKNLSKGTSFENCGGGRVKQGIQKDIWARGECGDAFRDLQINVHGEYLPAYLYKLCSVQHMLKPNS